MPSYRAIEVHTKSPNFRAATRIAEVAELPVVAPGSVVVKNHYVGINATDVTITNGAYGERPLPFSCGVEGVGEVVAIGDDVENFHVGDAIAYRMLGAFAEYVEVPAATALKVSSTDPAVLPLLVQGISASLVLDEVAEMKSCETVLVTAAAGGTGQFVVQLAKLAGNHVIGTTSSDDKAELLEKLGCDRVINYNKEDIGEVLKKEYPKGVDLFFESIGGDMFKTAVDNIAVHGRVIVFGGISGYLNGGKGGVEPLKASDVNGILLERSASARGFILGNHMKSIPAHFARLSQLIDEGKLVPGVDKTEFKGLEGVADAIDYMFARKNTGKLVVKLA